MGLVFAAKINLENGLAMPNLIRSALGDLPTEIHDNASVAKRQHKLDVVLDDQNGGWPRAHAQDSGTQHFEFAAAEPGCRFVEQEQPRSRGESARSPDQSLLAKGQATDWPVGKMFYSDQG